jgi:hypothetical protein
MHHFVTAVTAESWAPSYSYSITRERTAPHQSGGSPRQDNREHVMTSTIITAVAVSFLIVGTWAADLVCYQPQADSLGLLAPINTTTAWK